MRFVNRIALFVTTVLVLGLFALYALARHYRMLHYYEVAISPSSDTAVARRAIERIGQYRGGMAMTLLFEISRSLRPFIDNRQELSIHVIAARHDPTAVADLAQLLEPHYDLRRREAVAAALTQNVCNLQCTQNVLHYEERLFCGKDVPEEAVLGSTDESVNAALMAQHDRLIQSLNATLRRDPKMTTLVLRDTYGLGSPTPSSFALQVADSLELRTACPLVARSKTWLADTNQEEALGNLWKKLNCSSGRTD